MTKKQFYCEKCNRAVSKEADVCPHCGSSFKAVKCPKCGFVGKADFFGAGCPICGYLSAGTSRKYVTPAKQAQSSIQAPYVQGRYETEEPREHKRKKALPDWVYPAAGVVLLGIIAALVFMYIRL